MADQDLSQNPTGAYVYKIIVDGIPRYVGKGRGRRARSHLQIANRLIRGSNLGKKVGRSRFYAGLIAAIRNGATIEIGIVCEGLDDACAFELEQDEILKAPLGQLWNSAPGGEGQSSEYLRSILSTPERKEFFRQHALKAWAANPSRKEARFAEPGSREKQKEMALGKWSDPSYREKQSASRSRARPERRGVAVPALSAPAKERWANPEFREMAIARMKESGKSAERREAISRRLKAQWADPEFRAKRRAAIERRREARS